MLKKNTEKSALLIRLFNFERAKRQFWREVRRRFSGGRKILTNQTTKKASDDAFFYHQLTG